MAFISAELSRTETPQGTALEVYSCGGSIMSDEDGALRWILTAAHCVYYENLTMFNVSTYYYLSTLSRQVNKGFWLKVPRNSSDFHNFYF